MRKLLLTSLFCFSWLSAHSAIADASRASHTAHATIHVSVVVPSFCRILTPSARASLAPNEVSLTCNDPSLKVVQIEGGLAKLDTSPSCNQPTSALQFAGKIVDQRIFVCGDSPERSRLTLIIGL